MTAIDQARTAYGMPSASTRTLRGIEYDVFARVTRRLAAQNVGFPALVAALHDNRSLWTILAADVADPANGLPETLRARLFYLADFTMQHSRKILDGSATPDVLVEINTAVMRGLRGEGVAP